jgi:hypothetical protein
MFTMQYKRDLTHMALGTSGRDCIMLQRRKLLPDLQSTLSKPLVTARLTPESFQLLTARIR